MFHKNRCLRRLKARRGRLDIVDDNGVGKLGEEVGDGSILCEFALFDELKSCDLRYYLGVIIRDKKRMFLHGQQIWFDCKAKRRYLD